MGIAFLRLKTPIFSQVRKSPMYLIVMAYSLGFYLHICSQYFLSFSCNIQSIAIIIAPAFKI